MDALWITVDGAVNLIADEASRAAVASAALLSTPSQYFCIDLDDD